MEKMYSAEVIRDSSKTNGPGVFTLYEIDDAEGLHRKIASWPCITGGEQLDDTEYSGLTPSLIWVMTEPIANNYHPERGRQFKSTIVPVGGGKVEYYKRTLYGEDGYPFMIHEAGASTGCIAIISDVWDDFVEVINRAFSVYTFKIEVRDWNAS